MLDIDHVPYFDPPASGECLIDDHTHSSYIDGRYHGRSIGEGLPADMGAEEVEDETIFNGRDCVSECELPKCEVRELPKQR